MKNLVFIVIFAFCCTLKSVAFSGEGTGTEDDPFQITTPEQLQEMKYDLCSHYILMNDIDASDTKNWKDGEGFIPIGIDIFDPFIGVFDGNHFVIRNLYIDRPHEEYVGLFGYIRYESCEIKNIGIINCNITGPKFQDGFGGLVAVNHDAKVVNSYIKITMGSSSAKLKGYNHFGALVGWNRDGIISNCYSEINIDGDSEVGGLVGVNSGLIENSYTTGNVSGKSEIGGIAGFTYGDIINCYTTGDISGSEDAVGGLAGKNDGIGVIKNSYSTGNVSGQDKIGGLVGYNFSIIIHSYSTSHTTGSGSSIGGLVGENLEIISSCYTIGHSKGSRIVGGLAGNNSGNISNSYSMSELEAGYQVGGIAGHNYGCIRSCYGNCMISADSLFGGIAGTNDGSVTSSFWDSQASGISISPGGIAKTSSEMKNKVIYQNARWDFDSIWALNKNINGGYPYLLCQSSNPAAFSGNGSGTEDDPYQITTVEQLQEIYEIYRADYVLMNDIDASKTKNWNGGMGFKPLKSLHGIFEGNGFVINKLVINRPHSDNSALFKYVDGWEYIIRNLGLKDCEIKGKDDVGGIVAHIDGSKIINCFVSGIISGNDYVGGLVGKSDGGSYISRSFVNANVSGEGIVGGFAGYNIGNIDNSYSRGNVSGTSNIAGFIAFHSTGYLKNSYSAASVTSEKHNGGFLGSCSSNKIENCFWDVQISGIDSSQGGIGKMTVQMKQIDTFTDADWDFDSIWSIAEDINDGYPFLQGMPIVSVEEVKKNDDFNVIIYPNPVKDILAVKSKFPVSSLQIIDISGRKIKEIPIDNPNEIIIDVKGILAGVYFARINTAENILIRQFIVIP